MKASHCRRSRAGFTMVEILVVVGIIVALVALTTVAVMKAMGVQPKTQTMRDLIGLSDGAAKFKLEFGFYPPSKMVLFADRASYIAGNPVHQQSLAVIDKMFPTLGAFSGINWTGSGAMPAGGEELDGDQCLVFFLGGPGNQGFARGGNPAAAKTAGQERWGPFYDFPQGKLFTRSGKTFPSYMDGYSTGGEIIVPYVYFAPRMGTTRYDESHQHLNAKPYYRATTPTKKWHNENSCQIISAGADRAFGAGGLWTRENNSSIGAAGQDDQTNFHDTQLGS